MLLWWLLAAPCRRRQATRRTFCSSSWLSPLGFLLQTLEARGCGIEDPSHVVIDEVAGQLVTLIACPIHWQALLAGFILFRVFDILKPPPIRSLERLPEGTGIVVDDLGAGVYALIILQALLHFGLIR